MEDNERLQFQEPEDRPDPLEDEIRNTYAREFDDLTGNPNDPRKEDYVTKKTDEIFDAANRIRKAEEKSLVDHLTGLPNREALERAYDRLINLKDHGVNLDIHFLMLDLDHFKLVNDRNGHKVGDYVLKSMAKALQGLRRGDLAVRIGGEEFGVLLINSLPSPDRPEQNIIDPVELGNLIRKRVTDAVAADTNIVQTVSVGVSQARVNSKTGKLMTLNELKEEADIALYHSKKAGRNRVTTFSEGMKMPNSFILERTELS